ncbi:hypothetical protein BJX96DRAFT_155243 [Aspergillus floccosus]
MELTFHVSQDVDDSKRAYSRGACGRCRQRKKKCHHEERNSLSTSPQGQNTDRDFIQYAPNSNHGPNRIKASSRLIPATDRISKPRSRNERVRSQYHKDSIRDNLELPNRGGLAHRFLGDLNPIVFFAGDVNARLLRGRAEQGDVGIWLDGSNDIFGSSEDSTEEVSSGRAIYQQYRQPREPDRKTALLPPRRNQEALVDIYFRCIHPILPLVDEVEFRSSFETSSASPSLVQAICLVASKISHAGPHLCLAPKNGTIPPRSFSDSIYNELTSSVAMNLERKRTTLIQVLALLSFHAAGPKSFEDASMWLTQAIHHAFTIGLHLKKGVPTADSKPSIALFWSLWSLDRWNGAIYGRPFAINERDLGQQLAEVIHQFDAPFRVWLSLASTLSDVIVVYRPTLEVPVDENKPEIPRFEEILDSSGGWHVQLVQMYFLELAYHGIALLASRPWGLKAQPKSRELYLRQDLSVYRLSTLLQLCDIEQFLPFPTVAYCVSLGFALSFKQLKRCHLPSTQSTAKQTLPIFHKCLETLSPTWLLAQVMARLGQRALDGIHIIAPSPNYQAGLNQSRKPVCRCMDIEMSAGCACNAGGPQVGTDVRPETEAVSAIDPQSSFNDPMLDQPPNAAFPSENFSLDGFDDLSGDTMFEDIDGLLGDFFNINIPKCPTLPFFVDQGTAGLDA